MAGQEMMEALMDLYQQNVENTISSILSQLEETIKNWMDILVTVNEWTKASTKNSKGLKETELRSELLITSLHTQNKGLCEEIPDTKELCKEFF
jgi:hypothetical protein